MCTRTRTREFLALRDEVKQTSGVGEAEEYNHKIMMGMSPEWVDIVGEVEEDVTSIKSNLKRLQKLHSRRLKVTFDEAEGEQERDIDIVTQEVSRLLHKSENALKRIATIGNAEGTHLPQQERVVRLNVMRALASELQGLGKTFRNCQKDYLSRIRGQEESGTEWFGSEDTSSQPLSLDSLDEALDRGLTAHEVTMLQDVQQTASQRDQEIIRIAQSINDLATIFQELSVLVIEQGTVLDRIDYNVERALDNIITGTEVLQEADNYSKKARTMKCILLLLAVIVVLSIILVIKHVSIPPPKK